MAVKYYSDFNDDDGRAWHIVIHDTTYGGSSPVEFTCGADGFVLRYEGNDTDRSQAVIPSTIEFTYFIQNGNDDQLLADIAGSAEGRYQVEVYYGGASYSAGHLYWRGGLLADIADYSDEYYPQEFRLIAIDDLAGLRNDDFNTGSSGYSYVANLVANCLNRMRSWDVTSDTHRATLLTWYKAQDWNSVYRSVWEYGQMNFATFVNTDTFPSTYLKTYDVLQGILSGLGARIYWRSSIDPTIDSGFIVDGLNGQEYDTDSFAGVTVNNVGTTASATLARQELNLDSSGLKRLRGFRKGWLNPLLKVERTFKYPSSPFVVDHEYSGVPNSYNFHDGSYDATLLTAPTIEYGEGSVISLRFSANFNHVEGSTSNQAFDSVPKRAGRFKISAKLRFGQYYAQRALTIQGTTGVYVTDGGGFAQVVTFTENASNWSTSSNARIDWYTPPLVWTDEENLTFQMGIDLTPLPADLTSEDCTIAWTIIPVDSDGLQATYIAAIGDLFDTTSAPSILGATIYPTDIFEIGGSDITFKAENSNTDAREILNLPTVFFSDLLGTRGGGLFIRANGTRTQPSEWQSNSNLAADINLHNLVAKEYLQGQSRNIKKLTGEVRDSRTSSTAGISLIDTIVHSGDYYSIHGLEFTAARGIYRVDCLQLENSGTISNPTATFSGQFNNEIITGGRPPVTPVTEVITGEISEKVDLITITQAVNLDDVESDTNQNSSDIDSLQIFQQNTESLLKGAFTGGGAGIYKDSSKATTSSFVGITDTAAHLQAGANTSVDLTETSPGTIELNVATDSTGSTQFTAVTIQGNTTANTASVTIEAGATFIITGASGSAYLRHTGGTASIYLPSSGGTLARTADLYTNSDADARIALAELSDLANVNATSPTNGQVLSWDNSASEWVAADGGGSGGGGSDSFNTIQVSGQSDVVADSGNDTLTLAAGTNLAITTNATTDTITFTPSLTPTFTTVTAAAVTGTLGLVSQGTLTTTGNATIGGTVSASSVSSSGSIQGTSLLFSGTGTSSIAPVSSGAAFPDDLEITSNGNITMVLDYDSNESAQAFIVKNQAGTIIFQVDEDGISSGLFTSTTPTVATISNFEATQTGTVTVSNYVSGAEYLVKLFNSSDVEQTTQTITDNSDGTFSITNGPILTGAYITVQSLEFGKLVSTTTTSNTFNITAAATQQRYWRLQMTDASKNPVSSQVAMGNFRLYTATGGGGTAYPANMTSATTPSPYVVTRGYQYGSYDAWRAFDGSGSSAGSMWWTLSNSTAANNWIQIDLGSSIDLGSGECQITTSGGWTSANYAVLYGSNTGDFTGEEREMAFFENIDKPGESGGTFTTYTEAIT